MIDPSQPLNNARHEVICQKRLEGNNQENAHAAAGFKRNRKNAQRTCARPELRARLKWLQARVAKRSVATAERVIEEMVRLAFYDMTLIMEVKDGSITMRDPTALPEDLRRAIVAIKPVEVGETLHYECKFADKQRALDSLARHLQMYKDTLVVENVFRIVMEMESDELDRRLAELERAFNEATTLDSPAGEGSESIH